MAGSSSPARISNFTEFYSSLRLLSTELHLELRQGLKAVLEDVADDARGWADARGFSPPGTSGRGSGNLIGMIRTGLTAKKGYIVDRATNDGYSYPRHWEYADGGARAFFHPAIQQGEPKIYAGIDRVLEGVITRWNES